MMRTCFVLLILVCLFPWASSLRAESGREVPRKILAFYDSALYQDPSFTEIHQHAEVVLNHLGLAVTYRDIQSALPNDDFMKDYRGIITWFVNPGAVSKAADYCAWVSHQMNEGRRYVVLEEPGFVVREKKLPQSCSETLSLMGVSYRGEYTEDPLFFKFVKKDPAMVEFERHLAPFEKLVYSFYEPLDSGKLEIFLSAARVDISGSESALVFTSSRGGFAQPGYVTYEMRDLEKVQWRLNPFLFFNKAFGLQGLPRPDVTTINGRRVYFSHIDGDGIFNKVKSSRNEFAGEAIERDILSTYSGSPVSVSIIAGYEDIKRFRSKRADELYRKIYSHPEVEAASHGYAHPLVWKTGKVALDIPGYTYSATQEIQGSVVLMDDLFKRVGIEKKVGLFFWTGDCHVGDSELKLSRDLGLMNMNGGGSRFDARFDSYAQLFPLGLAYDHELQIYAPDHNENDYTHLWHGPFYGFREVIQTFRNTEEPLRIKPIDVYYHFYSGERAASLSALHQVYDWALAQPIIPVRASDYVRIVQDFFASRLEIILGGFYFVNNGFVRTLRFDDETRNVDLDRSSGVIGYRHFHGALYVSLDEGLEHAVYLSMTKPSNPYVIEASFQIEEFKGDPRRFSFLKKGWKGETAVIGGLMSSVSYRVMTSDGTQTVSSDQSGVIRLEFKNWEGDGLPAKVILESL